MSNKVELLGVKVDLASTKDAGDETISYIMEESSKVVYFFNSETLLLIEENSTWKEDIENCELKLPADAGVDNSIDQVLGYRRDQFYFESYLDIVLNHVVEEGYDLMLLTKTQEQFDFVQENIHEKRPYLNLTGFYMTEQQESLEHIVNEINSVAPDLVMISLDEKMQMNLLSQYRSHINAGVIIFVGNTLYHKAVTDSDVSEPIERMKMGGIYKWFQEGGRLKKAVNNIRIKLRIRKDVPKEDKKKRKKQ